MSKSPNYQAAFTLLELIIVLAIIGIIAAFVQTRSDSASSYQQDSVIEQIISAGQLTQQLSMNDSDRSFSLSISANQMDLLADGSSFSAGGINFPVNFGSQVTLSPVTTISFDSLGRTASATINVQVGNTKQLCFEASGYIHRC